MLSPRRIKLPLKQVVVEAFTLMRHHRVDLMKLALPFILFFTWMAWAVSRDMAQPLTFLFRWEYHPQYISIHGSWFLFMVFWMHAFFLVQKDTLEWPLSSFTWVKRYAFLTLYWLAYGFLLVGMQLIPFGIFFLFQGFFLNHLMLLFLFAVPLAMVWGLIVFYALIRFSFFAVGVVMDIPSALAFSWRFLKGNVMRVLVLWLGVYLSFSLLFSLVLALTVSVFHPTATPNPITASTVGFVMALWSTFVLALSACLDVAIYRALIPPQKPEGDSR